MGGTKIGVLGPTTVHDADGHRIEITRDAQRRLLAILACAGHRRVSTDTLIDRFWNGDPPPRAKGALQTHISSLRRHLPQGTIVTEGHGYFLSPVETEVDAWCLVEIADQVAALRREHAWQRVVAMATMAWSLGEGEPFDDLCFDDFALAARAQVAAARSTIDEVGVEALIENGEHEVALVRAERLAATHPIRERSWELLARARAGLGRQGEALRALHAGRSALADVGLEPGPDLRALEKQILDAASASIAPAPSLPRSLTSFVGRRADVDRILQRVSDHRLVTIVAAGGTGKSRLGLEIARRALENHTTDDAWLVELAPEQDGGVAERVAATVDIQVEGNPLDAVIRILHKRQTLLVLDNCEHLLAEAAKFVAELLAASPRTTVLATSRLPLGVPGERIEPLAPLPVPDHDDIGDVTDATTLFVERARAARPDFEPTPDQTRTIGAICRSLGGLPLAIELSAAQLWQADLSDLAAQQTSLASPSEAEDEPTATMLAAIEWSLARLPEDAADLLLCLSVVRGHFDTRIAAAITDDPVAELSDRVQRLTDAGFLRTVDVGGQHVHQVIEGIRDALDGRIDAQLRTELLRRHHRHVAERCGELRLFWMQPPERRAQPTVNRWWADLPFSIDNVLLAADTFERLLDDAHQPSSADLLGTLAHVAAAEGRHDAAVRYLEVLLTTTTPDDAELRSLAHSLLATELIQNGDDRRGAHHMALAVEAAAHLKASFASVLVLTRASLMTLTVPGARAADGVAPAFDALTQSEELGPFAVWRVTALVATMLARAGRADEAQPHIDTLVEGTAGTPDVALRSLVITAALNVEVLGAHDVGRIERWVSQATELLVDHPSAAVSDLGGWAFFVLSRLGRHDEAEWVLRLMEPVQGYEVAGAIAMRSRLELLRGDAAGALARAEASLRTPDPYWEPNLRTTAADAAADIGDLAAVRRHGEALELHPQRLPSNIFVVGALRALVRAEVDAALSRTGAARQQHERAAADALDRLHRVCDGAPPEAIAAVTFEPWPVYRSLADAEFARLDLPAEEHRAWADLVGRPRTAHFAGYVERRLVEADARLTDNSPRESPGATPAGRRRSR